MLFNEKKWWKLRFLPKLVCSVSGFIVLFNYKELIFFSWIRVAFPVRIEFLNSHDLSGLWTSLTASIQIQCEAQQIHEHKIYLVASYESQHLLTHLFALAMPMPAFLKIGFNDQQHHEWQVKLLLSDNGTTTWLICWTNSRFATFYTQNELVWKICRWSQNTK